jgi:NAD(P)-dependent dehydrogenase (short-subunit alcohol dehydrogenase family)
MAVGKLTGKVALVTGGARGLGRAYALRLAGLGAHVVVNDISLDAYKEFDEEIAAESVMAEIENLGVRSIGIEADVTDKSAVEGMFEEALRVFGRMDILVNNAGGMLRPIERGYASSMPEDDYRFIMDVNLTSTVFCCQAASIPMKEQQSGKIINVSSQAGLRGNPQGALAAYATAKAAINEYTRLLAGELGPYNINVNSIAPGLILTSRANAQFGRHLPENQEKAAANIPLRRVGLPEDCAKVVEFLATDLSDYVTGQCIPVCGGMVLSPS